MLLSSNTKFTPDQIRGSLLYKPAWRIHPTEEGEVFFGSVLECSGSGHMTQVERFSSWNMLKESDSILVYYFEHTLTDKRIPVWRTTRYYYWEYPVTDHNLAILRSFNQSCMNFALSLSEA